MKNFKDINKDTILNMLKIDVFGFKGSDIEEKAKDVYNLVSDDDSKGTESVHGKDVILAGGFVRNKNGYIILSKIVESSDSGKKKKK